MPSFTGSKLQIFDLDDTLVSTRQSYRGAQKSALKKLLRPPNEQVLEEAFFHLSWLCSKFGSGQKEQYFTAFLKSTALYSEKNLNTLIQNYETLFWQNLRVFNYVTVYLERLIEKGSHIAIVSNGKVTSQERKLQMTGLSKYFTSSSCYVSEQFESTHKKPSPYMIELVCNDFKVSSNDAVYYGNTLDDMIAGNLAEVTTVYFGDEIDKEVEKVSIATPDFQIGDWQEII